MRYKTALDFRRSLTHRHNEQARKTGTGVNDLHKRMAFERFLARLAGLVSPLDLGGLGQ